MAVGIAASAANVGLDFNDPKVRRDLADFGKGLGSGDFRTEDLGSLAKVGLDSVGLAPGVGAIKGVASMGKLADEAAAAGQAAPTLSSVLSDAARAPGFSTKVIDRALTVLKVPEPTLGVGVHAAPDLAKMNRHDTIELAWRGRAVISQGYDDVRDWLKS